MSSPIDRAYSRKTYCVADVFSDVPLAGNMLAVFADATRLDAETMQSIARELNLSETTFVLPPERGGLARVRIFTPMREMPFAGHPTIGTAFALVESGRIPPDVDRFVFEEAIGDVEVRVASRDPFLAWLRTPPISFGRSLDRAIVAHAVGLTEDDFLPEVPAQIVSAGNPFLYVPLRDAETVDRAMLSVGSLERIAPNAEATGVFFFAPHGDTFYSRMLAPEAEDPGTGSATGPLGAYLARYRLIAMKDGATFTNEQGVRMKRRCLIYGELRVDAAGALETVYVGGTAFMTTPEAWMRVPL